MCFNLRLNFSFVCNSNVLDGTVVGREKKKKKGLVIIAEIAAVQMTITF